MFEMRPPRRPFAAICIALVCTVSLALTTPAGAANRAAAAPTITSAPFGRTPDGVTVEQFTLTSPTGAVAKVITFGAIVTDLRMPDRQGKFASVVREITATESGFQRGFPQSAAVFGRVANRIGGARFTLDGREYSVTRNHGAHQLHGGVKNFSKVIWQPKASADAKSARIELTYVSADGEEGFPGQMTVSVTYSLTTENTFRIEYRATSDKPTPVNLTNHAYFNLAGGGDVPDHVVWINASRYTAVDADLIPTGELKTVAGSALDFNPPAALGARAGELGPSRRYDHNFVLNRAADDASLILAARVQDPHSGRTMETWTTEPGVQLYTSPLGPLAAGEKAPRVGFYCFETQHFPDSVNHPNFPSTILRPGQTFRSTTEFRFSAK